MKSTSSSTIEGTCCQEILKVNLILISLFLCHFATINKMCDTFPVILGEKYMAKQQAASATSTPIAKKVLIEKHPTDIQHVFLIDWNDDGLLKEIAVVMEAPDGSIYGIEIDKLHPIDKARLKKFLVSIHADKYALWELLSQGQLNNGVNPLDFFHMNYVKVKRPRGAVLGGGLATVEVYGDDKIIGSQFSDPRSAQVTAEKPEI